MRTKDIESDEVLIKNGSVFRSQLGLPQICIEKPKMVIELDENTVRGIISMFIGYLHEQGSESLNHFMENPENK